MFSSAHSFTLAFYYLLFQLTYWLWFDCISWSGLGSSFDGACDCELYTLAFIFAFLDLSERYALWFLFCTLLDLMHYEYLYIMCLSTYQVDGLGLSVRSSLVAGYALMKWSNIIHALSIAVNHAFSFVHTHYLMT
jgi:hypothetical protein